LLNYRADIEGLRAIAILLVIAYHASMPGLSGGFIGVDVFFVLSGYLITGILVRELDIHNDINFVKFYSRRTKRLAPGLCLTLLVTIAFSWIVFSPSEQLNLSKTAISTSLYASNLWFARDATDYLAADAETNPFLHTWSLSVEEQFYLVWPLFLLSLLKFEKLRSNQKAFWGILALVGVASLSLEIVLTKLVQPWAFFLSPTRAWEFALGALATLIPSSEKTGKLKDLTSWIGLALILGPAIRYSNNTTFPGIAALLPCVGTIILLRKHSSPYTDLPTKMLSSTAFQWLGKHSYSWYLWHWPILVIAAAMFGPLNLTNKIACAILSLLVAAIAFKLVEHPIRENKFLNERPAISLALFIGLAIATVGLSLYWKASAAASALSPAQQRFTLASQELPNVYEAGCHLGVLDINSPECVFGDATAKESVVLFGDSHAAQWFPSIAAASNERGFKLVSITKSECPAPSISFRNARLGRIYSECDNWRSAMLSRIAELHPKIIFIASSYQYPITPSNWAKGLQITLSKLSHPHTKIILLRDTPRPLINVPLCLARSDWTKSWRKVNSCSFELDDALNQPIYIAEKNTAKQFHGAATLDLTNNICESPICQPTVNDAVKFRDSNHLSVSFAKQLSPIFSRLLLH